MNTSFIAYVITNLITGDRYIGITKRTLKKRWRDHLSRVQVDDSVLYRAMRKYGASNFAVAVFASAENYEDLLALEQILIAQEKTHVRFGGYNMTDGGEGTLGWEPAPQTRDKWRIQTQSAMRDPARRAHLSKCTTAQMASPEMRALISRANRGRKHSVETRLKVSLAVKSRPPRSPETCAKLAAALRGRPRPAEVRAKVSAAKLGKRMSPEACRNMSLAAKGKPKSDAMRAKLRAYHARRRAERLSCVA